MSRPLFFQQRFLPMWTALSLGAFADNMLRQALMVGLAFGAIGMSGIENPDSAIPVIGGLFAVAMFFFSPVAGQIAEKYETAMLFRRIKFVEIALMAIAGVGFATDSGWILTFAMFSMGAQSAFFSPVRMSSMAKYLRPDELVRGNALCSAGLFVSVLIGMFFGGLLIAGANGGLYVAAILFAAALFGWLAILMAPRAAATAPDLKLDWNILLQALRIIGFAFKAPGVARPTLGTAFFWFVSTLVTVNVTFYARSSLGGDEALTTMIMGIFAIGAGLGAMAASALAKRRSGLGFSMLGIALSSAMAVAIYALTDAAASGEPGASVSLLLDSPAGVALGLAFLFSAAFMGLYVVPLQAATQRRAPSRESARIMAASNMMNAAAAFLGSLSVFLVTETALDPHTAFLLVAALQASVALYMWIRRRRVPEGLYDEKLAAAVAGKEAPPPLPQYAQS